jgi:urea transporter
MDAADAVRRDISAARVIAALVAGITLSVFILASQVTYIYNCSNGLHISATAAAFALCYQVIPLAILFAIAKHDLYDRNERGG